MKKVNYQFKVIPINKFGYENISHDIGDGFETKRKALNYLKKMQVNIMGTIMKYFEHDLEYYSSIHLVLAHGKKIVCRYELRWGY